MDANDASEGVVIDEWSRNCARQMAKRPSIAAHDLAAAKGYIATLTQGRSRFHASGRKDGACLVGAHARLGSTSFEFLGYHWGAECQTVVRPPGHHVILYFPLAGLVEARQDAVAVSARPGDIVVAGGAGELHRLWSGRCEMLNIVVAQEALARILAVDFAMKPERALPLAPLAVVDVERAGTLFRFVETVVSDLNRPDSIFAEPAAGRQAERTLLHIILKCILSDCADRLDQRRTVIAPYYIRRAEEFIRTHLDQRISIDEIAAAAGVSLRTLFYGFKKYRQSTPAYYLKRQRLTLARERILEALDGCRIGTIAEQAGYTDLAHFSRDYRNHFGESPLATLNRRGLDKDVGTA